MPAYTAHKGILGLKTATQTDGRWNPEDELAGVDYPTSIADPLIGPAPDQSTFDNPTYSAPIVAAPHNDAGRPTKNANPTQGMPGA